MRSGMRGASRANVAAVDLERREVAGVHADHLGPGDDRAVDLVLGVALDERRQPDRLGPLDQADQRLLVERDGEQQHEVGAERARLPELVRGEDEVLAQQRHVDRGADGDQIIE